MVARVQSNSQIKMTDSTAGILPSTPLKSLTYEEQGGYPIFTSLNDSVFVMRKEM